MTDEGYMGGAIEFGVWGENDWLRNESINVVKGSFLLGVYWSCRWWVGLIDGDGDE